MKNRRHSKNQEPDKPDRLSPPVVRPEWFFAVMSTVAGLFMAFVTPPFQSPDEDTHFVRAYQLAEGRVIAERNGDLVGGWIPSSVYAACEPFSRVKGGGKTTAAAIRQVLNQPFAEEPREFLMFMHTAIYSPVAYAPAVVGVMAGKALGLSALWMLYLSRVATLIAWTLIVFFAIRAIPVFKWVMVLIGLMPMSAFLAASPSADVMTNALAMLATGLILKSAIAAKEPVGRGEWAAIVVVCVLLSLTKQLYFLIAAMTLMIPVERFGGWRKKAFFFAFTMAAAIVANIIWAFAVRNIVTVEAWANPGEQTKFIFAHPLAYLEVLWQTLASWWKIYLIWFVGTLGWLDTYLPDFVWPTYLAVLIAAAMVDKGEGRAIRIGERLLLVAVFVVTLLLIATSQYVTYSRVMAPEVRGVQGRYFIPLAVPILLVLYNRKIRLSARHVSIAVMVFCAVVLAITCMTLVQRYYN